MKYTFTAVSKWIATNTNIYKKIYIHAVELYIHSCILVSRFLKMIVPDTVFVSNQDGQFKHLQFILYLISNMFSSPMQS